MDIAGYELTAEDQELLLHPATAGIILFTRNHYDTAQLKALTCSIHNLNPNLIIMADQEGGRVQRFQNGFHSLPSMREWGQRYSEAPEQTMAELRQAIITMAEELKSVGIQMNLMPVLDVDRGLNAVIGSRSFGQLNQVNCLAPIMVRTLKEQGMPSTGKHFPGHGFVCVDSHQELPVDQRPLDEIHATDMLAFRRVLPELDAIMPAHIIYPNVDSEFPVGFSKYWLQDVLRAQCGFKGVIISDDLSMNAASVIGDYATRALTALDAGCDLMLVCNCRDGVTSIADTVGEKKRPQSEQRLSEFYSKMN